MKTVSMGSGAMSWGDIPGPSIEMAQKADVQYIAFDFLAELTMSLLYRMKLRNPEAGYVPDLISFFKELMPIAKKRGIKLTSNGGGANPEQAGKELVKVAKEAGLTGLKIGVVTGDDFTGRIDELRKKGMKFPNMETGEEDLDRIKDKITGAYVYIGGDRITDALREGADVIIGGRISDNGLYVGPLMHEFGWDYKEPYWDKIGAAVTCGHIVECSCNCTGGMMCSQWKTVPEPWHVGYPYFEMDENGNAVITKTPNTGGMVNIGTIREHLVYEVHDPSNYLMPDGIADFTTLKLEEVGKDRVKVTNMTGKPRPEKLKLGIGYDDGWKQEIQQWFCWPDALEKAKWSERVLHEWIKHEKIKPEAMQINYMGINMTHGTSIVPIPESAPDLPEVGLRVCAKFKTREEAYFFRREAVHWAASPAGYVFNTTTAPPNPTRIIALWPTLVPRAEVTDELTMMEVK